MSRTIDRGSVVPAFVDGGTWSASFGLSWTAMMMHDQAASGRIVRPGGQYLRKRAGTMGVAAGRSEIVANFLATRSEWLFMVDTDMGFEYNIVDRLVRSAENASAPVIGALAFCLKMDATDPADFYAVRYRIQPTLYEFLEVAETGEKGFGPMLDYPRGVVVPVAGTGAACLLMHRDALAAVGPDPFRPLTPAGAGGNGTARTFSEDLSFCIRLQGAGIPLYVDTAVKTNHDKGAMFLDEEMFDRQQARDQEISARSAPDPKVASPVLSRSIPDEGRV